LSGGESQRLKLVRYLGGLAAPAGDPSADEDGIRPEAAADCGALLLLDEPTTGLHRHDVQRLIAVLQALVDGGHSLVVVEHATDVLKCADWIVEMGPEAGASGGRIVVAGTPELVAASAAATAPWLRRAFEGPEAAEALLAAESPAAYGPIGGSPPHDAAHPPALCVTGARENNLKGFSVAIPHRRLSVVTGISGSGKSTFAFDIVFAEGQRRFMESMSPYARQFVEQMPRPHVDRLTGIPPTVAIEQRVTRGSRKSTVATITEVAQYLRLLFARIGVQHNPATGRPVLPHGEDDAARLLARLLRAPSARRARSLLLLAPLVRGRKGHHEPLAHWASDHGYERLRVDGRLILTDRFERLDRYKEHDIEAVVADLRALARRPAGLRARLGEALRLGAGSCFVLEGERTVAGWISTTRTDPETGEAFPELDPKHFSFHSPKGWCPACRGHGRIFPWMPQPSDDGEGPPPELADLAHALDPGDAAAEAGVVCPECGGDRLSRIARAVKVRLRGGSWLSLPELMRATPDQLLARLRALDLDARGRLVAADIVPQVEERLRFLGRVGLDYLALDRATETLSGGEAQRIRLAAQLGTNLAGVLYVLDEPSIGLHARDNDRLVDTLVELRDKGNTLLVVEHDETVMRRADHIVDLGPGAGADGGHLLAAGTLDELRRHPDSLTGRFLAQRMPHPLLGARRPLPSRSAPGAWLVLSGARFRNLRGIDLRLPLARLIMVAGVSGAGKSSLVRDLLHPAVACAIRHRKAVLSGREFARLAAFSETDAPPPGALPRNSRASRSSPRPPFETLSGAHRFKSVIEVDQSPIGKTPRSTPATYLGIFDTVRRFFAELPEARMRGFGAGRFSFNTADGRCPACAGAGRVKLEMSFMPDAFLPCEACGGSRYGPEMDEIQWKGKSIAAVLAMTFSEAAEFFSFHAHLRETLQLMADTGLAYLTLGQSSPTLSGGEAQRLKLVTELARGLQTHAERSRGERPCNLYLLEEPTIGLHASDCVKLVHVLHRLVDQGHTVVVVEHHLDLLAEADYLVELGPGGGPAGGRLLHQGTVEALAHRKTSPTAPYLRPVLGQAALAPAPSLRHDPARPRRTPASKP
jgi:excinuclease ABC subunit A